MTSVLLADNHFVIRAGLRTLLQTRSDFHVCAEASDGNEAVGLAIQERPDIIIININLPGINGIDATRQICRNAPTTQILIFTNEEDERLMREALCAGASGYLLKSAPDEEIIEAVETLAAKRAYRSKPTSGYPINKGRSNESDAGLTPREREILQLVAQGYRNKVIAARLGISVKTVDTHRATAMRKLALRSTAEIVRYAIRENLIQV
jgi:DNA-binding NarL/FixJ family response regulator